MLTFTVYGEEYTMATHTSAEAQRAWRAKNPDRVAAYNAARRGQRVEYNAEWCRRNPEMVYTKERRRRLKRYGLTLSDYEAMLAAQGGKCAICQGVPNERRTVSGRVYVQLDVDHCHATNKVRGLLCYNCNAILGQARDNVDILRAAIRYIDRNRQC